MINNKKIIGVVGTSHSSNKKVFDFAKSIGFEITKKQQILLAGGGPENGEVTKVHTAAMNGAKEAGLNGYPPARLISILRKSKYQIELKPENSKSDLVSKQLIVETDLGDVRNFINGYVPDVLIVVHGGAGTLSEVAFACYYQTPVIMTKTEDFDTLKELQNSILNKKNEFEKILLDTIQVFDKYKVEMNKLKDSINDFMNIENPIMAETAEDAVNNAITIAVNRSNDLPENSKLNDLVSKYRAALDQLAK